MQVWGRDSKDLFTQHHMCFDSANRKSVSHYHLNASWTERNELNKCNVSGRFSNLVIQFRLQVSGNDSLDLFIQHNMCCNTGNRKTVSNFNLSASWPERNELTKWPLIGHLGNLVIKFRMKVWGNDSMDLFTKLYLFCDTANRNTFSHFHLNASWHKWNELTNRPFLGHLSKLVNKFRTQLWCIVSMELFT